jgi:hypothetical protein
MSTFQGGVSESPCMQLPAPYIRVLFSCKNVAKFLPVGKASGYEANPEPVTLAFFDAWNKRRQRPLITGIIKFKKKKVDYLLNFLLLG